MPKDCPCNKNIEARAHRHYEAYLEAICNLLSKDTVTRGSELEEVGKDLFGTKFLGIYCSDEEIPADGYCIVNTDVKGNPGEHWMATTDGGYTIYDSFGREKWNDFSGDAEQALHQTNCGQRSLAWLLVHHVLGAKAAATI